MLVLTKLIRVPRLEIYCPRGTWSKLLPYSLQKQFSPDTQQARLNIHSATAGGFDRLPQGSPVRAASFPSRDCAFD